MRGTEELRVLATILEDVGRAEPDMDKKHHLEKFTTMRYDKEFDVRDGLGSFLQPLSMKHHIPALGLACALHRILLSSRPALFGPFLPVAILSDRSPISHCRFLSLL